MKGLIFGALALTGLMTPVIAQEQAQTQTLVLPPVLFVSTFDSTELFDKLKSSQQLGNIDKENLGTPLRLVVSYKLQPTAGGTAAGLTSAILAGSSLGILPVVTNNDLVLTYDFRVHGKSVSRIEYRENFTQAQNMYSNQLGGLDKDAMAWVLSTTDKFVADLVQNQEVKTLVEEYNFYFGS
ncbi:hypothetical protein [Shewanella zhangzhouensis]|uniref:hypothetical protein n=1 Tax=Shewanella zhangzhouensis TaxID=2864213 RepID=UPI001C660C7B|nr:hypothetical protein [Shewanella zhangzhouensis]QYK05025.1 hypothetical protein K0H63_18595 [Shewanella zhangzhouensis]